MKPKKPRRRRPPAQEPPGAISGLEVRRHFGWSERTLNRQVADGLPVAHPGKGGRPSYYDLKACEAWVTAREEANEEKRAEEKAQESKWFEAWRMERHRELRRKNDLAEGRIFEAETVRREMQAIFGALRAEFEAIGRAEGPRVGDAIREAIERAEKAADLKFPPPPAGEAGPREEAS